MQPADCPVGAPDTRLLSGTLCFVARDMAVRVHRHHCLQLLLALRGSFTSVVGATTYDHQQSRLFASDVAHACDATGCEALVFFVEPTSTFTPPEGCSTTVTSTSDESWLMSWSR